jgi:hypothetical protein
VEQTEKQGEKRTKGKGVRVRKKIKRGTVGRRVGRYIFCCFFFFNSVFQHCDTKKRVKERAQIFGLYVRIL